MLESIHDQYRFTVHLPSGPKQMYPRNGELQWKWSRDRDRISSSLDLDTELVFVDDPQAGIDDFTRLHFLERDPDQRCNQVNIDIEMYCDSSYELFYKGYLALIDGEWDASYCRWTVKPRRIDDYYCYNRIEEKETNILDVDPPTTLFPFTVKREEVTCTYDDVVDRDDYLAGMYDGMVADACLSGPGWNMVSNEVTAGVVNPADPQDWRLVIRTTWERAVFITFCSGGVGGTPDPPPGGGWTLIADNCALTGFANWAKDGIKVTINPTKHARTLADILDYLLDGCGLTVVSNFFGINADASNPSNDAYTASTDYHDIRIAQITDIKTPDADEAATIGLMTLEELMEDLMSMFNVGFVINGPIFHLEHASYFEEYTFSVDMTVAPFKQFIGGSYKYEYDRINLPRSEKFKWAEDFDKLDLDFYGQPIEYDEICSYEQDGKDKRHSVNYFVTDIRYIIENLDEVGDDMFVIMATDDGVVRIETSPVTGEELYNGSMAWSILHERFHKIGRPQSFGTMNGNPTDFVSYNRPREQEKIGISTCCESVLAFDPDNHLFKTQMGWGKVKDATFTSPHNSFELNLQFK